MAGSIYVPLKTIYDDSGARKAAKSVGQLGKQFKNILGTLGVATSFGVLANQLEQAARAAGQDAKSFAVMANTIKNVTNASDGAISSSDKFIQKLQMQVGIADDQLRPVFAKLVTVTGDLTKSQDLLGVAADLAASKNIDLSTAGNALAKAVGGQTTALFRLAPELKKSSDWMATLKANTAGAAATAANADPFQRITVILGEMAEKIGYALLPAFESFANWLASDSVQAGLDNIAQDLADFVTGMGVIGTGVNDAVTVINDALSNIGGGFTLKNVANNLDIAIFGPLQKVIQIMGALQNAKMSGPDETSRLIRRRLESLGVIGVPDVEVSNKQSGATKKLATENKALTDAVNKAKAAFEAKVKAYQDAVKAAQDIIDSTKEMTASFVQLFAVSQDMGQYEQNTVSAFENIFDTIKSTLADDKIFKESADALTAYTNSTLATLRSFAKQQDVLAKKIDIAKNITSGVTSLANLSNMLETTTESITQTTRTMSNGLETIITKTMDVTKTSGLVDNFQKLVNKTKAFAKNLIDLKKLGLDRNLFAQLVNAGVEASGATAQAIIDGGPETINALNDLYRELDLAAADIAETSTETLYEVGQGVIKNGFIDGLTSQLSALATAAERMAKEFADTFNQKLADALVIKLPAKPKVPEFAMGELNVGMGFAAQLAGMGFFGNGVATSRGNTITAPQSVINLYLNAQGTNISGTTLAQQMIAEIKKYERSNGAVWVAAG